MKAETMFALALVLLLQVVFLHASQFKRVCYFTNWAHNRKLGGKFYPEDIDPFLCTHIIYAFADIKNNTLVPTDDYDLDFDGGAGQYARIMVLKEINPDLKISLAVGGWNAGSYPFEQIIKNDHTLSLFADNAVQYLKKYGFDGLDVDWEFPVIHKKAFTKLLETLKMAFDTEAITTGYRLLLTAAVSAGQATIDTSYEIENVCELVDFVNLMAYDLHGSWEMKTGFHSALYSRSSETSWEKTLNVDWSVNYYLSKGCPRNKIVLGMAFYGRGNKLNDPKVSAIGSPTEGTTKMGPFTAEAGVFSYYEICTLAKNETNVIKKFDYEHKVPSLQYDNYWIGYEDEQSLRIKADYIKKKCLGGFMIWTLDFDDFKGKFCDGSPYPLLHALNEALANEQCDSSAFLPVNTIKTPTRPTSRKPPVSPTADKCTYSGLIASQSDCTAFKVCLSGFPQPIATLKCPENKYFDADRTTCVKTKPKNCIETMIVDVSVQVPIPYADADEEGEDSLDKDNLLSVDKQINFEFKCPQVNGLFAHAKSCHLYWNCAYSIGTEQPCPASLVFNPEISACDFSSPTCQENKPDAVALRQSFLDITPSPSYIIDSKAICLEDDGLFANTRDCHSYYRCAHGIAAEQICPGGLVFRPEHSICDYTSSLCPEFVYKTNPDPDAGPVPTNVKKQREPLFIPIHEPIAKPPPMDAKSIENAKREEILSILLKNRGRKHNPHY